MGERHGDDGTSGETSDDDATEAEAARDNESTENAASPEGSSPLGEGFVADQGWASDASI